MNIQYQDILIRNALNSDCELLASWWNDGEVMAHAGFPHGLNTTKEKIEELVKNDSDQTIRRLIIEYKDLPIGEANFKVNAEDKYEIGIKICVKQYREKGLGRIILSMLIEELFNKGANLIFLDTNLENERAKHVYELLGFKKIRIDYDSWRDQLGNLKSAVYYELTKQDFHNYKIN